MEPVIVAEKGAIKPAKRRELEAKGYIVLVVDNVERVKVFQPTPPKATPEDDGFKLDG